MVGLLLVPVSEYLGQERIQHLTGNQALIGGVTNNEKLQLLTALVRLMPDWPLKVARAVSI